jgi:hypothetical protein
MVKYAIYSLRIVCLPVSITVIACHTPGPIAQQGVIRGLVIPWSSAVGHLVCFCPTLRMHTDISI